jgi:trehalose 6-phosphate synthase
VKRLVVVSNRVASNEPKASAGGLAVALDAALRESEGLWFGWSGKVVDGIGGTPRITTSRNVTFATIDLEHQDFDDYYNGYGNRTLWPLFHYRADLAVFDRRFYGGYHRVNALFAQCLGQLLKPGDVIWVHDFHLIPLGEELRKLGHKLPLGFFLHIPFPVPQILTTLFNHKKLVRSLLAYDLIGFQTDSDLRAFEEYVRLELGGSVDNRGVISAYGMSVHAQAFPIGIDAQQIANFAVSQQAQRQSERMSKSLTGRDLIIGVDRLDYTKGLPERLNAFEKFLSNFPDNRGRVTLLQIAPPSRSDVPEYVEIRHELETASGHINGRFSEFDWVPIRYINKAYNRQALAGLFRASRIGLVTPLRDGMNLVAKEFVAAQNPEDPGVLILSRFAGAAQQLVGALIVNPHDTDDVAKYIERALVMPLDERRERWRDMMKSVSENDLTAWREKFVRTLTDIGASG